MGVKKKTHNIYISKLQRKVKFLKIVEKNNFENMIFADFFEKYLNFFFIEMQLKVELFNKRVFQDDIEITIANEYLNETSKCLSQI